MHLRVLLLMAFSFSLMAKPALAEEEKAPEKVRMLVLDFKSTENEVSENELTTLAGLAASHLTRFSELEVMTAGEMKSIVALEEQRQVAGCDDESCLAEIANAIGARLVVMGQMGSLGNTKVLNLSMFDSEKARVASRATVKAATLDVLAERAEPVLDGMVNTFFGRAAEVIAKDDPTVVGDKQVAQKAPKTRKSVSGAATGAGAMLGSVAGVVLAVVASDLSGGDDSVGGGTNSFTTYPNGPNNDLAVGVQSIFIGAAGAYLGGALGSAYFTDTVGTNIVGAVAGGGFLLTSGGFMLLSSVIDTKEIQAVSAIGAIGLGTAVAVGAGGIAAYILTPLDETAKGKGLFK